MSKKTLFITLFFIGVVGGLYGVQVYSAHKCTNPDSVSWKNHRIIECALYYDEAGVVEGKNEEDVDVSRLVEVAKAHIPSFGEIDDVYGKDRRSVYYKGTKIVGAKPETFALLGGEYFTDSRYAYWRGGRIATAQADRLELFPGDERYARDGLSEYFNGDLIVDISEATSSRVLLSPFHGDEVTQGKDRGIVWRQSDLPHAEGVGLLLVGDDGEETWLTDETLKNTGSYTWKPYEATTSPDTLYHIVFYGHTKEGVVRSESPHVFSVVEEGKASVSLMVNFSGDDVVKVSPEDVVNVSWSGSNVQRCYLVNGVSQPIVGHISIRFPQVGGARVTKHLYYIECIDNNGVAVEDSVTIESIAPEVASD